MGGKTGTFSDRPENLDLLNPKHRNPSARRTSRLFAAILALALITAIMWTTGCAGLTSSKTQPQTPLPPPPPSSSLAITTSSLPAGQTGAAYQGTLAASGGNTPYTWSLSTGTLPTGLSLNASSGAISGTPSASGTSSFTVQVKDSASKTTQQALSIAVSAVSSGPLSVANALLAGGQVGQLYSVTLRATGGTPSYSWSITSGQLPAGLALGAASGLISGTPTASGQSSITVSAKDSSASAQTATKALTITISASTTDQYGGILSAPSPNGGTGYFRVEKFGNGWMFVTPDGNAFWSFGVFAVDMNDTVDDLGSTYRQRVIAKYGNADLTWGPQQVRRLRSWGFNTVLDHSSLWVRPIQTCSGCAGWQNGQPEKIAAPWYIDGASYPLRNVFNYCAQPGKDIFNGINRAYYNGYVAPDTDPYDPCFSTWINSYMKSASATQANSPWTMGFSLGESDYMWGFGAGSTTDFATVPPGHNSPHLGWIVLITSPTQTSNSAWNATYTDTTVYAKQALQNFLQTRYGTIAALNTAWGSSYTAFGSAGGWGTGTGLLDEDGRHTWVGNWDTLAGETAAMQTDLNDFLFQYASQWFKTQHDAVKAVYPNMLYLGPNVVGSWGTPPRKQILQAAGLYIDVLMTSLGSLATDDQARLDYTMQYLGDKPIASWTGFPANPDSSLWRYANPATYLASSTQAQRGQSYSQLLNWFWNATVTSTVPTVGGTKPYIGVRWWGFQDAWAEKTNWGLVSLRDNAYDGKEATVSGGKPGVTGSAQCKDPWGYPCGAEERDYGDFISSVRDANMKLLNSLVTAGKSR